MLAVAVCARAGTSLCTYAYVYMCDRHLALVAIFGNATEYCLRTWLENVGLEDSMSTSPEFRLEAGILPMHAQPERTQATQRLAYATMD